MRHSSSRGARPEACSTELLCKDEAGPAVLERDGGDDWTRISRGRAFGASQL